MADIGKALGVSTSGAKMRISRGVEKLRDLFHASPAPRGEQPSPACKDP